MDASVQRASTPPSPGRPQLRFFDASPGHVEHALQCTGADYCCFWAFDEKLRTLNVAQFRCTVAPPIMAESKRFSARPGEDAVGRVWVKRAPELVKDPGKLTQKAFSRQQLAVQYDIRSIAFHPYLNGVLEYGSRAVWERPPSIDGDRAKTMAETHFDSSEESLRRIAEVTGADYAIFWLHLDEVDELKSHGCYAVDGKVMRKSTTFTFTPGYGAIGSAWLTKESVLISDVSQLSATSFKRAPLAAHFGVKSIALEVAANGVLVWGRMPSAWKAGGEAAGRNWQARHGSSPPDCALTPQPARQEFGTTQATWDKAPSWSLSTPGGHDGS